MSAAGDPPYKLMDWHSVPGVLIPLMLVFVFPLIHILLYYLTRWRLQRDEFKNHTILKVLQLAGIYSKDSYRFSQYSKGDASLSLSQTSGGAKGGDLSDKWTPLKGKNTV